MPARAVRVLLVPLAAGLLLAVPAAAAPVLDQQQPTIDNTRTLGIGGSVGRKLAQVVTPGVAGMLTELQLPVRCQPGSQLALEIRNAAGSPEATVVASQTASVPVSGRNFHAVTLANPPFFAAEDDFAFVLTSAGSCDVFPGPADTNSYVRGGAFSAATDGSWVPYSADLAFKTFVEPRCRVPSIVGRPEGEARKAIADNGCAPGGTSRAYSTRVRKGSVVSQSPPEGTFLAPRSAVAFVLSLGRACNVPRLRGRTLARTRAMLRRANCRLGRVTRRPAARSARGRVVAQRPSPGRRLPGGTRVSVALGR